MKCDCIKIIEEKMVGQQWKGKNILTAKLQKALVFFPKVDTITFSTITAKLEGKMNKVEIEMLHTYCPYCGTKINDEASTTVQECDATKASPATQKPDSK